MAAPCSSVVAFLKQVVSSMIYEIPIWNHLKSYLSISFHKFLDIPGADPSHLHFHVNGLCLCQHFLIQALVYCTYRCEKMIYHNQKPNAPELFADARQPIKLSYDGLFMINYTFATFMPAHPSCDEDDYGLNLNSTK